MADAGTLLHAPDVLQAAIGRFRAWSSSMHRLPTTFADWPRQKASIRPRSRCWCSIARATPRHPGRRSTGAAVRLITDGDVAASSIAPDPEIPGRHVYRTGGGAEASLAAAALRCIAARCKSG